MSLQEIHNFPWPTPTEEQKTKIEQTAQAILDARAKYPDSSLADLYDELTMPVELRKAHQDNDRAVMQAYGFNVKTMTESQCVAELFKLYKELTTNSKRFLALSELARKIIQIIALFDRKSAIDAKKCLSLHSI